MKMFHPQCRMAGVRGKSDCGRGARVETKLADANKRERPRNSSVFIG